MRQSQFFTKAKKNSPSGELAKNAQVLIKAGFVHKEMAGVYSFLPLGLRVIEKIKSIVREEMNTVGGQELVMTSLQRKDLWETTDRWSEERVDVWFKTQLQNGAPLGLAWSHEEPITAMMCEHIHSYKDLPVYVYQFQTKLRNELRAKSGIMRGREFLMKDMYSYSLNAEQHQIFYDKVIKAYLRVFDRVGLGSDTFVTFASGGAFTEFSHEFQTVTDAGEDTIYINRERNIAINEEVLGPKVLRELGIGKDELEEVKTAEVGNIFNFGTKKCEQLGLVVSDSNGEKLPVFLGSYGIGISRLMGVVAERFSDGKTMLWPKAIAPFSIHLISLCTDESMTSLVGEIYQKLLSAGVSVLYDDRPMRPGQKFAESDLIGIPHRVILSKKTITDGVAECVDRINDSTTFIPLGDLADHITSL